MLKKVKKNLQFVECLPLVIDAQVALLEQWCKDNGWSNLEVTSNLQFRAVPPGGVSSQIVPVEAFSKIKNQEISGLLSDINSYQQLRTNSAAKTWLYNIACICLLVLKEQVKNAIKPLDFAVSVYWLIDISTVLAVILAITSIIESLFRRGEYSKLKNKLVNLLDNHQEDPQATPTSSWLDRTGLFKDDPLHEEFLEDMAAYRHELDSQMAALEAEETQQEGQEDCSD